MNKLLLMFALSLFLFTPLVTAVEFNFTGTNYTLVTTDITGYFVQEDFVAYNFNNYWYVPVNYIKTVSTYTPPYMLKLNENFVQLSNTSLLLATTNDSYSLSCKYFNTSDNSINCIQGAHNTTVSVTYPKEIFKYSTTDNTKSSFSVYTDVVGSIYQVASSPIVPIYLWCKGTTCTDWNYTKTNNLNSGNGEGQINFPLLFETPQHIKLDYCGGALHVFMVKSGVVYDLIYDYNDLSEYKNSYAFWYNTYGDTYISPSDFNTFVEDDTLYITFLNNTYGSETIEIMSYSCNYDYTMDKIYSKTYLQNQTIFSGINYTNDIYARHPYLTKDDLGVWTLFYTLNSNNKQELKVAKNLYSCDCTNWVAQNECNQQYQKYIRGCVPSGCETNINWTETTYCGEQYNESLGIITQKTSEITKNYVCQLSIADASPISVPEYKCSLPIEIPFNCSNVKVNASLFVDVDYKDVVAISNDNTVEAKLCLPETDCNTNTTMLCSDFKYSNITYKKNYDAMGGQNITYTVSFKPYPCGVPTNLWNDLFKEGWRTYTAYSYVDYSCTKNCGGYKCINRDGKDYSVVEKSDCSLDETTETYCPYTCKYSTGLCMTSTGGTSDEGESGECADNDRLCQYLHPNASKKFIYALIGCVAIGFILVYLLGGVIGDYALQLFLVGFGVGFIIFTYFGWISFIFVVFILAFLFLGILLKVLT